MTSPLLLTGPLGSGKTTHVLACLREALKAGRAGVRLLVPTATMAEHLRHRLAREGYAFQPGLISTLSRFIERWVPDLPEAGGPDLYLLTEKAIKALDRPEFAQVAHMPGFAASLAGLIEEFSSTGCSARRLRQVLATASLESALRSAFLTIYEEVSRQLEARGWATRADRLMHAAARIRQSGVGEVETVWMDGFLNLSDPELSVVEALSIHTELTVTAPEGSEPVTRLRRMGFAEQSFERRRPSPEKDTGR